MFFFFKKSFGSLKFACTIAQEDLIVLCLYICNSIPRRDWKISWCLRCACFMFMLEKRSIEKPADFMLMFPYFPFVCSVCKESFEGPTRHNEEVGLFTVWPDLLVNAVATDLLFCCRSWDVFLTATAEVIILRFLGDFDVAEEQCYSFFGQLYSNNPSAETPMRQNGPCILFSQFCTCVPLLFLFFSVFPSSCAKFSPPVTRLVIYS